MSEGLSIRARCNAIEECYEFMLAYAAQGLSGEAGQPNAGALRTLLEKADEATVGLADAFAQVVASANLQPVDAYDNFLAVLARDAKDSLAAMRLVLAQPAISSQLVDNLNASIHVRALLTDIFIVDEILMKRAHALVRE